MLDFATEREAAAPVLAKMKRTDAALDDIEAKAEEAKMTLLQREIEREWRMVQRKKPHWEKVLFGNGTFCIVGMRNDEDPWKFLGVRDTLRGAVTDERWNGPEYLRYFWYLLEAAEGGLNDLVRKP